MKLATKNRIKYGSYWYSVSDRIVLVIALAIISRYDDASGQGENLISDLLIWDWLSDMRQIITSSNVLVFFNLLLYSWLIASELSPKDIRSCELWQLLNVGYRNICFQRYMSESKHTFIVYIAWRPGELFELVGPWFSSLFLFMSLSGERPHYRSWKQCHLISHSNDTIWH